MARADHVLDILLLRKQPVVDVFACVATQSEKRVVARPGRRLGKLFDPLTMGADRVGLISLSSFADQFIADRERLELHPLFL
jgi:hypothetical protein